MINFYSVIDTETGKVLRYLQCLTTDAPLNLSDGESLVEGIIAPDTEDLYQPPLRDMRDNLLALSDWTQFPDSPLSKAKKTKWSAYRQALRDIPETYADATSIDDIIWPTKPE